MGFFGSVGRLVGRVADVRKKLAGKKDDRKTEQDGSTSRLPLARRTSNHSFDGVDRGVRDTHMEPSETDRERGQLVFCQGILGVPKPDGVAKRYFVLTHDQLKYYATKENYYRGEQPRGLILLHEVIDVDFVDDTLHVKVNGTDRPVLFIPDPLEDIPTWLEAFAEVLTQQHPDGARLSEKMSVARMSVRGAGALARSPTLTQDAYPEAEAEEEPQDMEGLFSETLDEHVDEDMAGREIWHQGVLLAKASSKDGLVLRYFALTSEALVYYESLERLESGKARPGAIKLDSVKQYTKVPNGYELEVSYKGELQTLELQLIEGDDEDLAAWTEALDRAILPRLPVVAEPEAEVEEPEKKDAQSEEEEEGTLELIASAAAATTFHTWLQVDHAEGMPTARQAPYRYFVQAEWQSNPQSAVRTTECVGMARESSQGETCHFREQLSLELVRGQDLLIASLFVRRKGQAEARKLGSCVLSTSDSASSEVRKHRLLDEDGHETDISLQARLRVTAAPAAALMDEDNEVPTFAATLPERTSDLGVRFVDVGRGGEGGAQGRVFAGVVTPGSWAESKGLRHGDELELVNGSPASSMTRAAVAAALANPRTVITFKRKLKSAATGKVVDVVPPAPFWLEEEGRTQRRPSSIASLVSGIGTVLDATSKSSVALSMKVENVSFALLSMNPALVQAVKTVVKKAIARAAGHGIEDHHVGLRLGAGAVLLRALIDAAPAQRANSVREALGARREALCKDVASSLASVLGSTEVVVGPLVVKSFLCKAEDLQNAQQDDKKDVWSKLHEKHQERSRDLQRKRMLKVAEEDAMIERKKAEIRKSTKARLTVQDTNPAAVSDRLYKDFATRGVRLRARTFLQHSKEQFALEEARTRRSLTPTPRDAADAARVAEAAGQRLHALHQTQVEKNRLKKVAADAQTFAQMDRGIACARARGVSEPCHEQLYEQARERMERMMMMQEDKASKDMQLYYKSTRGKVPDMSRVVLWQMQAKSRQTSRRRELKKRETREQRQLEKDIVELKEQFACPEHLQHVVSKVKMDLLTSSARVPPKTSRYLRGDVASTDSGSTDSYYSGSDNELGDSTTARLPHAGGTGGQPEPEPTPLGFGSRRRRLSHCTRPALGDGTVRRMPLDHTLHALNVAVAQRCGCTPEDEVVLNNLLVPLTSAIEAYRAAAAESERRGTGAGALRSRPSQRMFNDGFLMDEADGRVFCREPDPIMQPESSLERLQHLAAAAQQALQRRLLALAPDTEAGELEERWPAGTVLPEPPAFRGAAFAVNPGLKSLDEAAVKAYVRYGPSARSARFQHLMDWARVGVVFPNAAALELGLEAVLETFDVYQVSNLYSPSAQTFLGQRYVQVLVVLTEPEVPGTIVCEMRLEEQCFFEARERAEVHIREICDGFCESYKHSSCDAAAVRYLARCALQRSKESHAMTIFRRNLARSFGSTPSAWRTFGCGAMLPFKTFRKTCQGLGCRDHTVEYWKELDQGRAGQVSLFDIDPDSVILLAKFYAVTLAAFALESKLSLADARQSDTEVLFKWMLAQVRRKLQQRDKLEAADIRALAKLVGFSPADGDRVFGCLVADNKHGRVLSEVIGLGDIEWLASIERMVDLDAVFLRKVSAVVQVADKLCDRSLFLPGSWNGLPDVARRHIASASALGPWRGRGGAKALPAVDLSKGKDPRKSKQRVGRSVKSVLSELPEARLLTSRLESDGGTAPSTRTWSTPQAWMHPDKVHENTQFLVFPITDALSREDLGDTYDAIGASGKAASKAQPRPVPELVSPTAARTINPGLARSFAEDALSPLSSGSRAPQDLVDLFEEGAKARIAVLQMLEQTHHTSSRDADALRQVLEAEANARLDVLYGYRAAPEGSEQDVPQRRRKGAGKGRAIAKANAGTSASTGGEEIQSIFAGSDRGSELV